MAGQTVHIDKPPLAASSAGNAEMLTRASYRKIVTKAMGRIAIVSVLPNGTTIHEHGIHNTVSIDHATLALGNEPSTGARQLFPVEEDHSQILMRTAETVKQYLLNTSLTKYYRMEAKDMPFSIEFASNGIHQSIALLSQRSACRDILNIATTRKR